MKNAKIMARESIFQSLQALCGICRYAKYFIYSGFALGLISCAAPPVCDAENNSLCSQDVQPPASSREAILYIQMKQSVWKQVAVINVDHQQHAAIQTPEASELTASEFRLALAAGEYLIKLSYQNGILGVNKLPDLMSEDKKSGLSGKQYKLSAVTSENELTKIAIPFSGIYRFTLNSGRPEFLEVMPISNVHKYHKQIEHVKLSDDEKRNGVSFSQNSREYKYRRYAQTVNSSVNRHAVTYSEKENYPRVRSGTIQFDALFALALDQVRKYETRKIHHDSCECFAVSNEAGVPDIWNFALAVDLGLPLTSRDRVLATLEFFQGSLVSKTNTSDATQEYQYLLWILAFEDVLKYFEPDRINILAKSYYPTLRDFVEYARDYSFSGKKGLYTTKELYLLSDSRKLTEGDLRFGQHVDEKTFMQHNLLHYVALRFVASLAQLAGDNVMAVKYSDWASDLRFALNQHFWNDSLQAYSVHQPHPNTKIFAESLAQFLAVENNIVNDERFGVLESFITAYDTGLPVIFSRDTKISQVKSLATYRRLHAPFLGAYLLEQAQKTKSIDKIEQAYTMLISAASQNLLHSKFVDSGTGAAIDSKHSIAASLLASTAYFRMVVSGAFGLHVTNTGIYFNPVLTSKIHQTLFSTGSRIQLLDLSLRGKKIDVVLQFPGYQADNNYLYPVLELRHNGEPFIGEIPWDKLPQENTIIIRLGRKSHMELM